MSWERQESSDLGRWESCMRVVRWQGWRIVEVARLERSKGSEVASWERWEGSEVARWER